MTTVPSHASRAPRRRVWPWVVGAVGAVLVLLGALFAWDGWQLLRAKDDLTAHAQAAQQAVSDRDAGALSAEVEDLQASAATFASHTSGVHWTVASWIPWVKDQTVPLRRAGESVEAVAADALGPLSQMGDLSALEVPPIENGRIDPYVLEPYRETLAGAAGVMNEQREALDAVDVSGSIDLVRENYLELESQFTALGDLVQGAHVAAELLPPMLGAEGERTYIVMVQNNAEPRTSGGIAGAVIELTVNDGRFTFARYVTGESMQDPTEAVASLTEDEMRVFGERMVWYPQDVNFTPEFPRAAELLSAFWEREFGQAPDGVISTDPVGLGYMLAGMPPVEIDGISVTGENLAQVMMRDVYYAYEEPEQTDLFFALASRTLFGELLAGSGDQLTSGLEQAASEQRLLLWSASEGEQSLLDTTGIAGDFIDRDDALGIFLNDGSGSKIGYFVDTNLTVVDRMCASDGSLGSQTVTYELTHTFDGDVADLPEYIGIGGGFVPNGEFHTNVLVFPPTGMGVTHFTRDGKPALVNGEVLHGREFSSTRVLLLPGQTTTLEFTLEARDHGIPRDAVLATPGPKLNVYNRSVDSDMENC